MDDDQTLVTQIDVTESDIKQPIDTDISAENIDTNIDAVLDVDTKTIHNVSNEGNPTTQQETRSSSIITSIDDDSDDDGHSGSGSGDDYNQRWDIEDLIEEEYTNDMNVKRLNENGAGAIDDFNFLNEEKMINSFESQFIDDRNRNNFEYIRSTVANMVNDKNINDGLKLKYVTSKLSDLDFPTMKDYGKNYRISFSVSEIIQYLLRLNASNVSVYDTHSITHDQTGYGMLEDKDWIVVCSALNMTEMIAIVKRIVRHARRLDVPRDSYYDTAGCCEFGAQGEADWVWIDLADTLVMISLKQHRNSSEMHEIEKKLSKYYYNTY